MIAILQQVMKEVGDLPCVMRDALGIYNSLSLLAITTMDEWTVLDAQLPAGVGVGSRVVAWE